MLYRIREELEEIEVLARLGRDVHAFPNMNSFEHTTRPVTSIAKQNEGWLKSRLQGRGSNRRSMPVRPDAVVASSGPPTRLTLSAFAESAFERELERMSKEHNRGKRFPALESELKGGRPIK